MMRCFLPLVLCAAACLAGCAKERSEEMPATQAAPEAPAPRQIAPRQLAPGVKDRFRALHQAADSAQGKADKLKVGQEMAVHFDETASLRAAHLSPVRQDLAARASRLLLDGGDAASALKLAEQGLELSSEASALRANLLMVKADCHESLGQESETRATLMQALEVNQQLLDKELETP